MQELESLISIFKADYPYISMDDVAKVVPHIHFRTINQGEKLVDFNQQHGNVVYIVEGLVKSYYIDKEGNETIFRFEQTGQITGNWHSTLLQQNSQMAIQAIEKTTTVGVSIDLIENLAAENLNIARAYNHVLKNILADTLQQLSTYTNEKPEVRYLQFLEKMPDLLDRITQKELASYLGVTPVSLSRIKKRVGVV